MQYIIFRKRPGIIGDQIIRHLTSPLQLDFLACVVRIQQTQLNPLLSDYQTPIWLPSTESLLETNSTNAMATLLTS